jgi:hypothetical protein
MPWAAAAAAAAAIGGAAMQSNSAKKASTAQGRSEERALEEQRRQYDLTRADTAPYREGGAAAVSRISDLLGISKPGAMYYGGPWQDKAAEGFVPVFSNTENPDGRTNVGPTISREQFNAKAYLAQNPDVAKAGVDPYDHYINFGRTENRRLGFTSVEQQPLPDGHGELTRKFTEDDFHNDPVVKLGLQYGLDEGAKAINLGAGAAGLRNSGATLKALTRFGQDYAGTKAVESYNRFYGDQDRIFNRLSGLSGTGQTATTNTAALGQQSAQNIGNILTAGGNARGAAAIARGNAYGGALNTIGNYYTQQQSLDKILGARNQGSQPYYTGYGVQGDYQYG